MLQIIVAKQEFIVGQVDVLPDYSDLVVLGLVLSSYGEGYVIKWLGFGKLACCFFYQPR